MRLGGRSVVSITLAVGFVVALFVWGDRELALVVLPEASLPLLAGGLLLLLASYGARCLRLAITLRLSGAAAHWRLVRLALVHNALVNLLPMRGGDLAFPLLLRRTFAIPLAEGAALILWLRLQDVVVLLTLTVLFWPGLPWPLRVLALGAALLLAARLPMWLRRALGWVPTRLRLRAARALRLALVRGSREVLTWSWTTANWLLKFVAAAALLSAFGVMPPEVALAGAAAGEAAALLPVQGVAGIGTYEGAIIGALALHGVELQWALAAAVAAHATMLATALAAAALISLFAPGDPAALDERTRTQPIR
jgi:uncharacterized membrane protein YbhN (UPF0104 family)